MLVFARGIRGVSIVQKLTACFVLPQTPFKLKSTVKIIIRSERSHWSYRVSNRKLLVYHISLPESKESGIQLRSSSIRNCGSCAMIRSLMVGLFVWRDMLRSTRDVADDGSGKTGFTPATTTSGEYTSAQRRPAAARVQVQMSPTPLCFADIYAGWLVFTATLGDIANPSNSVRRESRRSPVGANPTRPSGRSAESNQGDGGPSSLRQQVINA
jgi:hypothetical protein